MQSVEGMILAAAIRLDLTAFIEQREPEPLREDHHLYSPVAVTHGEFCQRTTPRCHQ